MSRSQPPRAESLPGEPRFEASGGREPVVSPPISEDASAARFTDLADFRAEVLRYDAMAKVKHWDGPRYRMPYRVLGEGPPLFLIPGIASTYRVYALLLNRLAENFRTIVYDYPGENPDDGARLSRITHDDLVDDIFGLADHLDVDQVSPVGLSFGSTVTLRALHREPQRFPRAVLQGGFAHRTFTAAERWALRLGRLFTGTVASLPMRNQALAYSSRQEFPPRLADRWQYYLEENALTPIRSLAHRVDLLTTLDHRAILSEIPTEVLLIHGDTDRIVPRPNFEVLRSSLPKAQSMLLPSVGHQPHFTHAEMMADLIRQWLLPQAGNEHPSTSA